MLVLGLVSTALTMIEGSDPFVNYADPSTQHALEMYIKDAVSNRHIYYCDDWHDLNIVVFDQGNVVAFQVDSVFAVLPISRSSVWSIC